MSIMIICWTACQQSSKPIIDINGKIIISKIYNNDKCNYVREDGEKIIAYTLGVEFRGGADSLKYYLDSNYYNNPHYDEYGEFNIYETFFILFDKDLNIREVRIKDRSYADHKRFYYDNIFIDSFKNTKGRWYKTVENKEWYIYLHHEKIY